MKKRPQTLVGRFHDEWDPMHWQHDKKMYELTSSWLEEDLAREKAELENSETLDAQSALAHIEMLIKQLKNAQLETEAQDDREQQRLLHDAKQLATDLMRKVLVAVRNYMSAIQTLEATKRRSAESYGELKDYINDLKQCDEARTRNHDALIHRLNTAIRFISHTFGRISEDAQEQWEEEREARMLPILRVKRITLPSHVICPTSVNLHNRISIGTWASHLYDSLTVLEKKLPSEPEES